jgi:hypothetical protein
MGCCLLWANGPQESAQGASPGFCDHAPYRSRPRSEGAQETRRTGLNCAWPPCPLATLSCAHSGRALCARRLAGAGSQGSTRQGSARPGLTPSRLWRGSRDDAVPRVIAACCGLGTEAQRVEDRRKANSQLQAARRVSEARQFRAPRRLWPASSFRDPLPFMNLRECDRRHIFLRSRREHGR